MLFAHSCIVDEGRKKKEKDTTEPVEKTAVKPTNSNSTKKANKTRSQPSRKSSKQASSAKDDISRFYDEAQAKFNLTEEQISSLVQADRKKKEIMAAGDKEMLKNLEKNTDRFRKMILGSNFKEFQSFEKEWYANSSK